MLSRAIVKALFALTSACLAAQTPTNIDRLLERAQSGHVEDQLKLANAFRSGFGAISSA